MHRLILVTLAVAALILAWVCMTVISWTDPWYRNTDMNIHNLVDALVINSDVRPNPFNQPAVPLKYLLALDLRLRHEVGALSVWNLKRFGRHPDPLSEIPPLIRVTRVHSRVLVIVFIFCAAGLTYNVTRRIEPACFIVILLCGSTGLLFHGLLSRPELLCVGFGNVLALWCAWRAVASRSWGRNHLWLLLAGLLVGLSTLEKLPGVCYLGLCYGWCWMAALTPLPGSEPERIHPPFWSGLLAAAGGVAVFVLLLQLGEFHAKLGPVVITRLRTAAFIVALLPLLSLWPGRRDRWSFLQDRIRELALLGAGFLASLLVSYLLLRGVMNHANAADYFAGVLHFVIDPAPYMTVLMDTKPETGGMFLSFLKQAPLLFLCVTAVVIAMSLVRSIPLRLKLFSALLWAGAVGMALVMSQRHYAAQYEIFSQVPLLLVLALSLFALGAAWQKQHPANPRHWLVPIILTASCLLVLTSHVRLHPTYTNYQNDAGLPVNDFTLTFLFDHDDHPAAYVKIMQDHYGDRKQFAAALERYLADPANRY